MADAAAVSTMQITVDRKVAEPGVAGDIAKVDAGKVARAEQLRAAADTNVQRLRSGSEPAEASEVEAAPPTPPVVEQLASIELKLPNGKIVLLGTRPGISAWLRMAQIQDSTKEKNQIILMMIQTVLKVLQIDGVAVEMPKDFKGCIELAERLGDEGLDLCLVADQKYWPGVSMNDLPVLKKNLRQS